MAQAAVKAGPSKLQRVTFATNSFHGDSSPTSPLPATEVRRPQCAPSVSFSAPAAPLRAAPPAPRLRQLRLGGAPASQSAAGGG